MPSDHGFIPSSHETELRRRVKAELRKRMRGLRTALPSAACAERSARIVGRVLAVDGFASARSVALFWPIEERHEVDVRALDEQMRARGARVAYPAMETVDDATGGISFRFVANPELMQERGRGFREPSPSDPHAQPGELDYIVVPALAIDTRGHRIGYGAGYYDSILPRFAPPAVTVAVAYDFQLIAEVPQTDADVPVTWIVTDTRTLEGVP